MKGFSETYRRNLEVMEYSQHEKILFDVNVWGKQSLQRAQILLRLLRTQKGFEQQWKPTISLSAPTGVRDLHFATGSQYRERVMFSINAYVADYINVSTPSNEKGLQHERNEKLRQKAEKVIDAPPEVQPVINPKLEAALITLDDATDEKSFAEIVEHCTLLSAELSEDEKIQLREKIKATKKRLMPAKKDNEVWMARHANGTGDAWRFQDGDEIVHGFFEAEKKAKETGTVLEKRNPYRFSPSH